MTMIKKLMSWRDALLVPRAQENFARLPAWQRLIIIPMRIVVAVSLDFLQGQLTLRAMSLVYTTLLSLVPLLAISFSILKGFGVHNRIEPFLQSMLEPLGEKGVEITKRAIDFVNNIQVGVLGAVGFLLLFYTVISLLQKIERSLNYIWHVPKERSIPHKVRDYLSVVVLGPVLIIGGMGVLATLMSSDVLHYLATIGPFGLMLEQVARLSSIAIIVGTFAFIYAYLPNTKVRFWPAVIGGLVAGVMWIVIGWGFASFIVSSTKYTAIYSAFAILILFMIWLYLLWLIVLLGSAVSFYAQNPQYIGIKRELVRYAITLTEKVALIVIYHIVHDWYQGSARWTTDRLAHEAGLPMPVLVNVIEALEKAELISSTTGEEQFFIPGRPPELTSLKSVLDAVRNDEGADHPRNGTLSAPQSVETVMKEMDAAVHAKLEAKTIKDFALAPATEVHLHDGAK
ncbi:MAG: membrane protein [Alphaproteobacteria bacterium]|jgi:membrane protein